MKVLCPKILLTGHDELVLEEKCQSCGSQPREGILPVFVIPGSCGAFDSSAIHMMQNLWSARSHLFWHTLHLHFSLLLSFPLGPSLFFHKSGSVLQSTIGLYQNLCRDTEPFMEIADHLHGKGPFLI